jgi:protein-S-isoprenylcysteine O-methyltransferase Ste14
VLGDRSLLADRSTPNAGDGGIAPRATWAFALEPIGDDRTHLVARVRVEYEPSLTIALLRPIVRAVHALMERKQLRTLKERAERRAERRPASLGLRAQIKMLVGAGDRIMAHVAPVALGGLAANLLWPSVFRMGLGAAGLVVGGLLVAIGIPLWLTSAIQILVVVPKGKLITRGPFALVLHPLYTSVALLVIPGFGLLFDSWLGFVVGLVLYAASRLFAPSEERELAARFPEYPAYRARVLLPWL